MALGVTTPCYCTREDVKRALDIKDTTRNDWQVDRAIQSAARNIDAHMHRVFYIEDTTHFWDWPNFQYSYPWRIWFDQWELADVTSNVPVVTTGGTVITAANIFWGPWNGSPPFTYIELNRSTTAAFGVGQTPQQSVSIKGTFGYWTLTDPAGTLAAAISSTSTTTITVSDASVIGVGSLLIIDSERLIVQNKAATATGQTIVSGVTTASAADNALTVSSGAAISKDEVLLIDSEQMLAVDITGNVVTVIRAWNGSVLTTHSTSATVNAYRSLIVLRGQLGTTAATHNNGATISTLRTPTLIRDLAIAEASVRVAQEVSGYSENVVGPATVIAAGLPDLWDEAETGYGRKARRRVV